MKVRIRLYGNEDLLAGVGLIGLLLLLDCITVNSAMLFTVSVSSSRLITVGNLSSCWALVCLFSNEWFFLHEISSIYMSVYSRIQINVSSRRRARSWQSHAVLNMSGDPLKFSTFETVCLRESIDEIGTGNLEQRKSSLIQQSFIIWAFSVMMSVRAVWNSLMLVIALWKLACWHRFL